MKKILAIFLSLIIALGISGCGDNMNKIEIQDFSKIEQKTKNITIGGLIAPPPAGYHHYEDGTTNENFITTERYVQAAEAGFDFLEGHAEKGFKSPEVTQALNSAKEAGIKYMVNSDILLFYNSTPERIKEAIGDVLEHEGCFGVFAVDEPQATRYDTIAMLWNRYKQATGKFMEVNLLPFDKEVQYGVPTYDDYVEQFCQKIDTNYISVDIYPFYEKNPSTGEVGYGMYDSWLYNLETIQNFAVKYGNREHWECVQGQKVHGFSKLPDYNDIRMQIYTSMTYGASAFQYYCYWTPEEVERPCLIDKRGNPTSIYYDAKKVNLEIKKFGNVFVHFAPGWKGVLPVGESKQFDYLRTPLKSYPRIKSVQSTDAAIIGAFNDGEGRDAFMITNCTVPGLNVKNTVTVNFNDAKTAICYIGGEKIVKETDNGKLTLELGAGEGVFVVPEIG